MENIIFTTIYCTLSVVLAMVGLAVAFLCFQQNNRMGQELGTTTLWATVVNSGYMISILTPDPMICAIFCSVYFLGIDWMLVSLLGFVDDFINHRLTRFRRVLRRLAVVWASIETLVCMINPFYNLAVSYVHQDSMLVQYQFQMKWPFYFHLAFTYILVLVVLAKLTIRTLKVPRQFRGQYDKIVAMIILIVAVNAVFLYLPKNHLYTLVDYSIIGYSLCLVQIYWSAFRYAKSTMLRDLSMKIFSNIDQGIVLFDYENRLIMNNTKAEYMLPQFQFSDKVPMQGFLDCVNISMEATKGKEQFSVQCYPDRRPLRCDYRMIRDKSKRALGYLFVFTDVVRESDILTGFQNLENCVIQIETQDLHFSDTLCIAAFDINGLGQINSEKGKESGDRMISDLADTMRAVMPRNALLIRGLDAVLFAVCENITENRMRILCERVKRNFEGNIEYAMASTEKGRGFIALIEEAVRGMENKKLLDAGSAQSQMIASLVRALKESDEDTEAHVQRTQKMGAVLAERINMTDIQMSELSLLCLLHDIGKIGIPLEILNKPGKLSNEEWEVLKAHAAKGYQIARSSKELTGIADMILHHHERWDGNGYPDHLRGDEIPLLSRVISVVDAYDAMVNDRAYRKAMTVEEAKQELSRCAGTQFDPYIVSEFLKMLELHPEIAQGTSVSETGTGSRTIASADAWVIPEDQNIHPIVYSRYVLDSKNKIIHVDEHFEILTGYTMLDVQHDMMNQLDLIPEIDRIAYTATVQAVKQNSNLVYLEHSLQKKDGSIIQVRCSGEEYYDSAVKEERSRITISLV